MRVRKLEAIGIFDLSTPFVQMHQHRETLLLRPHTARSISSTVVKHLILSLDGRCMIRETTENPEKSGRKRLSPEHRCSSFRRHQQGPAAVPVAENRNHPHLDWMPLLPLHFETLSVRFSLLSSCCRDSRNFHDSILVPSHQTTCAFLQPESWRRLLLISGIQGRFIRRHV
jgi:hypothetical protein